MTWHIGDVDIVVIVILSTRVKKLNPKVGMNLFLCHFLKQDSRL
jgi:hypothetical protein